MPYKDLGKKAEWERQHRLQRLARRRELRRLETARQQAGGTAQEVEGSGAPALWMPLVAGGALAAYNPTLGVAAGALTLLSAAVFKKGWSWWIVGVVILAVALWFRGNDQSEGE